MTREEALSKAIGVMEYFKNEVCKENDQKAKSDIEECIKELIAMFIEVL